MAVTRSGNVGRLRAYLGFETARHLVWRWATLPPEHPFHLPATKHKYRMLAGMIELQMVAIEAEVLGPAVRHASREHQQVARLNARRPPKMELAMTMSARDYDQGKMIARVAYRLIAYLDAAATALAADWHEDELPVVRLQMLHRAADQFAETAKTLAGGDLLLAALALIGEVRLREG